MCIKYKYKYINLENVPKCQLISRDILIFMDLTDYITCTIFFLL